MKQITAEDVFGDLRNEKNIVLVDVRTPEEYVKAHIHGAINIPLDTLAADIQQKIPDKSTPIYLYCLSGSRSIHGAMTLEHLGYTNICDMQNGLLAWRIKRFPLESRS